MIIDNFALTMFQSCPSKYNLRIRQGWTTRRKSAALGFGGAFHEGLATWYKTGDAVGAVEALINAYPGEMPIDDWRTKEKCVKTLIEYMHNYPSEQFGIVQLPSGPMIEVNFTLPLGTYLPCDDCWMADVSAPTDMVCSNCNGPKELIEYGGIFDGVVEFNRQLYIFEHKTTSQLGDYYFDQFRPNNQVTGYVWAGGLLSGQRVGGAIINAIGMYKVGATKFRRQVTARSAEDIARWINDVHYTCVRIKQCERDDHWPMHTTACTMYGKCEFHMVHVLPEMSAQQRMLEQEYVKAEWDHETRDEVKEV
ncbi:MAG TPA: PD-(D/E)XK nuclease family protein [Candidatus Paceibacterota bacterium]